MFRRALCWGVFLSASFFFVAGPIMAQERQPEPLGLLEAVRVALARQPNIAISQQDVEASLGALQSTRGAFDYNLLSSTEFNSSHTPYPPSQVPPELSTDMEENVTTLSLGVEKKFRSGVIMRPSLETIMNHTSPSLFDPTGNSAVVFELILPRPPPGAAPNLSPPRPGAAAPPPRPLRRCRLRRRWSPAG